MGCGHRLSSDDETHRGRGSYCDESDTDCEGDKFDGVSEPIAAYDAEIDREKVKGLRDLACEV